MGSFDYVDYRLRPNKNIERKLIVELLNDLSEKFPISEYRYIGMGSMWFVDFKLFHKLLAIQDMISIEREAADRARFNRPFNCVEIHEGEASIALRGLEVGSRPSIIWLDYDGILDRIILEDVRFVAANVAPRSIVAITVNAHHGQLRGQKDEGGRALEREEALRRVVGNLAPEPLMPDALNRKGFPTTLVKIFQNAFSHALRKSGRPEQFHRLFAFTYSDGAPMVSVGGIVVDSEAENLVTQLNLPERRDYLTTAVEPYVIDVPPLTSREKVALDQLLPRSDQLTPLSVKADLEFSLKESQLTAFQRFYRQYPLYGEVLT